jgi:hypothetical protein
MNFAHNLTRLGMTAMAIGFVLASFGFVLSAVPVGAQNTQVINQPQKGEAGGFVICGNEATNPCTIGHLFAAFVVIINYLITMAGLVAVLALVFAGFNMIYSQGQEQLKAAKSRFSGAVIGLVLVFAAYVLINSLFTGSLSIGVCDGKSILTSPLEYIRSYENCK